MKQIYIVITQPKSSVAAFLQFFSHDEYNHSSILLDNENNIYSFGRKYQYFPFIGGFVKESPKEGFFERTGARTKCLIYQIDVTDDQYEHAKELIGEFIRNKDQYRYNLIGLVPMFFKLRWKRDYHFTCSQFVGYILHNVNRDLIPVDYTIIRPIDFTEVRSAKLVYKGTFSEMGKVFLKKNLAAAVAD